MKTVICASLLASAAAFAPASHKSAASSTTTALAESAFPNELGAQVSPLGIL